MVKGFLSQRGVSYEERDVSRNQAYAQELVNSTGQMGVPVTVFDGEIIVGFDRARLEQLLPRIQANRGPSFGASIADAARITAKQVPATPGAYVGATRPGSPARTIGLVPGDIIIELNKQPITNAADLECGLSDLKRGDRFWIVFLRGTRKMSAEGTL